MSRARADSFFYLVAIVNVDCVCVCVCVASDAVKKTTARHKGRSYKRLNLLSSCRAAKQETLRGRRYKLCLNIRMANRDVREIHGCLEEDCVQHAKRRAFKRRRK